MDGQRDIASHATGMPGSVEPYFVPPSHLDDDSAVEVEDRPGQRRRWTLMDGVFYAGCAGLSLLPASLAGVLLYDFIGEPLLFLLAVAVSVWVVTMVLLVKIAGPALRCRAIVAGGGLVSVAMCSLFLLD